MGAGAERGDEAALPPNVPLHDTTAEELVAALAQVSAVQQERISGNVLNIVREAMRATREQHGDFCSTVLQAANGRSLLESPIQAPLALEQPPNSEPRSEGSRRSTTYDVQTPRTTDPSRGVVSRRLFPRPGEPKPLEVSYRETQFQPHGTEPTSDIGRVELRLPDDTDPLATQLVNLEDLLLGASRQPGRRRTFIMDRHALTTWGAVLGAWAVRPANEPYPTVWELETRLRRVDE